MEEDLKPKSLGRVEWCRKGMFRDLLFKKERKKRC